MKLKFLTGQTNTISRMAPFSGDDRSNSATPRLNRDFSTDHMRISAWSNQGGRRYMEDSIAVHCERHPDGRLHYIYVGVFDGHGGRDASEYARKHLLKNIVSQETFDSENDADILNAIREGFIQTHHDMWKEVGKTEQKVSLSIAFCVLKTQDPPCLRL